LDFFHTGTCTRIVLISSYFLKKTKQKVMNTTLFTKLILICIFFSFTTVDPPAKKFPASHDEFINELELYVTSSKEKTVVATFESFEKHFKSRAFNKVEMDQIITICNAMLEQKMPAKPFYIDYLSILSSIAEQKKQGVLFQQWHDVLSKILGDIEKRKIKPYKNFLHFSLDYFNHGTLRYSKSGVNWKTEKPDCQFVYLDNEPQLIFETTTLLCTRKGEQSAIKNTAGTFFPNQQIWKGKSGRLDWDEDQQDGIYAEFKDYQIDVTKALYKIDNALLHFSDLFPNGPIEGTVENKLTVKNQAVEVSYPRFNSSELRLEIQNLGQGVRYQGGFQLEGRTIKGSGSKDQKAIIEVDHSSGQLAFRSLAESFSIKIGEQVSGHQVRTVLFPFGQDSIFHPSVNFKFDINQKSVTLSRGKRGSDRMPFFDSYHGVNIDSDRINWNVGTDSLMINLRDQKIRNAGQRVTFESFNYFDVQDYRRYQNVATYNPISILRAIAEREGRDLKAIDFATKINAKFDVSSIKSLLYDLMEDGFIQYDSDLETIRILDKSVHYAKASQGKTDFDNIRFISDSEGTNAVMNTTSKNILVKDVKILELSSKRKVAARPAFKEIVLKQNRDIDFDGRLFAGFGMMEGKDFHFDYAPFSVKMDSIRYLDLFVPNGEVDKKGNPVALSIASRIEHTNAILLIDAPSNKSGKDEIDMFPSINTKGPAYVYYDHPQTMDTCYSRDSFYFELKPFSFNSLTQFTKEDLHFDGKMTSAGIFPEFEETLVLDETDFSLGFTTETGDAGFQTYQDKGLFKGTLSMSNRGFIGKGNLKYLWASIDADSIVYRPNQMTTSANNFELKEDRSGDVKIPEVSGQSISIDWQPYQDSMYIQSEKEAFQLFKSPGYQLHSLLILTPGGLKGRGQFDWDKGSMNSALFSFGSFQSEADTADLSIRSADMNSLALNTKNVYAKMDFDAQIGSVKANADTVQTTLPYNQYITSMNEYDWDMNHQNITFKADESGLGTFLSTAPDQDGLNFEGETAFYDLNTSELKIGGVPFIKSADAFIYPENGEIEISNGGIMSTLNNARIIADTINKYHVINRAKIQIKGRKEYTASGFYEYHVGEHQQEIEFADIIGTRVGKGKKSEKKTITRATGTVDAADHFYIDHKTLFQGKIGLSAEFSHLQFDGFAQLDVPLLPEKSWFSVSSKGDKNKLTISYDTPISDKGHKVHTGLFIDRATGQLYPRVMMPLKQGDDRPVFEAKGVFRYEKEEDLFRFGDSLKVVVGVKPGNLLELKNTNGAVIAEGQFQLGKEMEYVNILAAGKTTTAFGNEATGLKMDAMTGFDFYVPEKLMKLILTDIKSSSFDAQPVNYRQEAAFFDKALSEFIADPKVLHAAMGNMKNYGLDIPEKYNPYTFLFSHLPLKWIPEQQSFISFRDKIAVGSIQGEAINRWFSAVVEVRMPGNGDDSMSIYLKSPSDFYYFFNYKKGILSIASNNPKFNEELDGMKEKERMIKKDGETFEIQAVTTSSAQMFLNRIKLMNEGQ